MKRVAKRIERASDTVGVLNVKLMFLKDELEEKFNALSTGATVGDDGEKLIVAIDAIEEACKYLGLATRLLNKAQKST